MKKARQDGELREDSCVSICWERPSVASTTASQTGQSHEGHGRTWCRHRGNHQVVNEDVLVDAAVAGGEAEGPVVRVGGTNALGIHPKHFFGHE